MDSRFLPLDRSVLLDALIGFLTISYESTLLPQPAGRLSFRTGEIPSPLQGAGQGFVTLSGEEADRYNQLRAHLRALRETEWLSAEDLDGKLWTLACEVALTPESFASPGDRRSRAETFLSGVVRDLRIYEVIIDVEHLAPPERSIRVWGAELTAGSRERLAALAQNVRTDERESYLRPFLGKAIMVVQIEGTAANPVIERGRALAHHRLHVFRAALASHWQTASDQLRFSLGEHACARALTGPADESHAWARRLGAPINLTIHPGHDERLTELEELDALLRLAHSSLRLPAERAYEWIGRGLCRTWPGDALRDFTTALEALLLVPNEANKSALLPYRMLALADLHGKSMIHPAAIRHAYDRRSVVIHQGDTDASDPEVTRRMLSAARDCLDWLLRFGADHPNEDHAALLRALDTDSFRKKALDWLTALPDPWSQQLVKNIRSLPK